MLTRAWYMSNEGAPKGDRAFNEWREEKHQRYFLEIALEAGLTEKDVPATRDEIREALANGDIHLNTIPLARWDQRSISITRGGGPLHQAYRRRGDVNFTPYDGVCPLKALARHLAAETV